MGTCTQLSLSLFLGELVSPASIALSGWGRISRVSTSKWSSTSIPDIIDRDDSERNDPSRLGRRADATKARLQREQFVSLARKPLREETAGRKGADGERLPMEIWV